MSSSSPRRKQVVEYGHIEAEQNERIAYLEKELAKSLVAQKATQVKLESTLKQMKSVAIDATLHARAELMEEFKVGKHSEWDLDYEISFWKKKGG